MKLIWKLCADIKYLNLICTRIEIKCDERKPTSLNGNNGLFLNRIDAHSSKFTVGLVCAPFLAKRGCTEIISRVSNNVSSRLVYVSLNNSDKGEIDGQI